MGYFGNRRPLFTVKLGAAGTLLVLGALIGYRVFFDKPRSCEPQLLPALVATLQPTAINPERIKKTLRSRKWRAAESAENTVHVTRAHCRSRGKSRIAKVDYVSIGSGAGVTTVYLECRYGLGGWRCHETSVWGWQLAL